jgi:hypothetical protein
MTISEWCPTCGANIVMVTRGIPSMGTCSNGHKTDRRDVLRRPPADPVAQELAALRAENARLRAETDAFRMCVNCGLVVPALHDRAQPGPGCEAPDACTFDMTPREAWEHWRAKAHQYRADAAAAVAFVKRVADVEWQADEPPGVLWCPDEDAKAYVAELEHHCNWTVKEARDTLALSPVDGLAEVEALRKERDDANSALDSYRAATDGLQADLAAAQAQIEALRGALSRIAEPISVPVKTWQNGINFKAMYEAWRRQAASRVDMARAALAALPAKEGE